MHKDVELDADTREHYATEQRFHFPLFGGFTVLVH